jgi:hypothetical protein
MDPFLLRVKSEASIANSSGPAMHAGVAGFRARLEDSDNLMISEKHEDGYGEGDDTSSHSSPTSEYAGIGTSSDVPALSVWIRSDRWFFDETPPEFRRLYYTPRFYKVTEIPTVTLDAASSSFGSSSTIEFTPQRCICSTEEH